MTIGDCRNPDFNCISTTLSNLPGAQSSTVGIHLKMR